jgi:hypothetical protein
MDNKLNSPGEYFLSNGIELTEAQRTGEENDLFRKYLSKSHVLLSDLTSMLEPGQLNKLVEEIQNYEFTPKEIADGSIQRSISTVALDGKTYFWEVLPQENGQKKLFIHLGDDIEENLDNFRFHNPV